MSRAHFWGLSGWEGTQVLSTFSPEWPVTGLLEKSKGGLQLRRVGRSLWICLQV